MIVQQLHVWRRTSIHAQEIGLSPHRISKTVKQQTSRTSISAITVIKLHQRFADIYCNPFAMAKPTDVQSIDYSRDKSVVVMDCRASITMTGSLLNCVEIVEKITTIRP